MITGHSFCRHLAVICNLIHISAVNWLLQFGPPLRRKKKKQHSEYYILKYLYTISEGGY